MGKQGTGNASEHNRRSSRADTTYDGVELTDEDLELVVGGLSLEAATAHARSMWQDGEQDY